jgi:hypothetical protein
MPFSHPFRSLRLLLHHFHGVESQHACVVAQR